MIQNWLEDRRLGRVQADVEIEAFVAGVVDGSVTRPQAAAWLAFVNCRGMTAPETAALTRAMTDSGERLAWPGIAGPFVDKHSTGGVGDKVSLILAPLWAELGLRVPMLSGRGLGITGGTLDKLESIPGYRTDLQAPELHQVLEEVGCFINGQTEQVAPADRILYALRDETGTVPSVPLITASILSKKLVAGLDRLVLDVKCGSGAFMHTRAEAEELAASLATVGAHSGLEVETHLSDMDTPLGCAIGNALEVVEAVECLQGGGPEDLRKLVVLLSGEGQRARDCLARGDAYPRWQALVRAHGGDPEAPLHGAGCAREVIEATASGRLQRLDAGLLGRAAWRLGAGRAKAGDPVHWGVGIVLHAQRGARVEAGQPLMTLFHAGQQLNQAGELARQAIDIGED